MATVLLSFRRRSLHGHSELKLWHFREAFGSSHIASSAYQTWPTSALLHARIRSLRVGAGYLDPNKPPIRSSTATRCNSPSEWILCAAILRETSAGTSYKMVRLVFRPHPRMPPSICTSERLIASTKDFSWLNQIQG